MAFCITNLKKPLDNAMQIWYNIYRGKGKPLTRLKARYIMNTTLFLIFKQIGEYATRDDVRVEYVIGENIDAQNICNELNSTGTGYYYYMNSDEVKKEGIEI